MHYHRYYSWCHLTTYLENAQLDINLVDDREIYKDDIKLFAKNEKKLQLEYSQDLGMEFAIEKCAMLVMKSGKQHLTDGMELQDKIRMLGEKLTYKYFGILEADTIKQVEMKD